MENRIEKCIACENRNFKYYADNIILRLPIYICQNCNMHVTGTSQIELDAVLSNYYKGDYWDVVREQGMNIEHTGSYSKGRIRIWTSQFKYVKKFISKKSKILEINTDWSIMEPCDFSKEQQSLNLINNASLGEEIQIL